MRVRYHVVDLFAGPGGLAEGFAAVEDRDGEPFYRISLSAEKEESAHRTLTLRSFTRQYPKGRLPDRYYQFVRGECDLDALERAHPVEWAAARHEALRIELGTPDAWAGLVPRLDSIRREVDDRTVVIGGPPCQAYSLVGRARNAGIRGYRAEEDHRHFLYREYIRIIDRLQPAAFVMENVKGLLSSSVAGRRIFEKVLSDLECAGGKEGGYQLLALAPAEREVTGLWAHFEPRDFVVRSENFGIPQARHRVFVVGLRRDIAGKLAPRGGIGLLAPVAHNATARDLLEGMPPLRSGLSRGDSDDAWRERTREAMQLVLRATNGAARGSPLGKAHLAARKAANRFSRLDRLPPRSDSSPARSLARRRELEELHEFLFDPRLEVLPQHESRSHMASDLARYFFCAAFAQANDRSPKASEFPDELAPQHANWSTGKFADRFRVQRWNAPSSTVTSHISKDGHYFIHPDPLQCRSLTVREAARLQTFPDNYVFLGNRTEQYVQVGNAVPPFLAKQIGRALSRLLASRDELAGTHQQRELRDVASISC